MAFLIALDKVISNRLEGKIGKIVIAPDAFKESLAALEVTESTKRGFKRVIPDA